MRWRRTARLWTPRPRAARTRFPPKLRARLHYRMASCYMRRANYRQALDQLDLSREALPRHLDKIRLAKIYARRGYILIEMGQYARAERHLVWSKKLLSGTNEHEELANLETHLGTLYARVGRSERVAAVVPQRPGHLPPHWRPRRRGPLLQQPRPPLQERLRMAGGGALPRGGAHACGNVSAIASTW